MHLHDDNADIRYEAKRESQQERLHIHKNTFPIILYVLLSIPFLSTGYNLIQYENSPAASVAAPVEIYMATTWGEEKTSKWRINNLLLRNSYPIVIHSNREGGKRAPAL